MKIRIWALLNKDAVNLHWAIYRVLTATAAFICITLNIVLTYSETNPNEGIENLFSLYFFTSLVYFLASMLGENWLKTGIIVSLVFSIVFITLALGLWLPDITGVAKTLVRPSAVTHTVSVALFVIFHSFVALMTLHTFMKHRRKNQPNIGLHTDSKNSTKD